MHLKDIDLNLLRLFDAVHRTRNVSRAAEQLELTQPAASQGLTRLRLLLKDPLFVRAPAGVRPTPKADQLAEAVRQAMRLLEQALGESAQFEPARSLKAFRLHLSDIGESRFLPVLMGALREAAPGVRLETAPVPAEQIAAALDEGRLDFAFGFLPTVKDTQRVELLRDRYIVLLRARHPMLRRLRRLHREVHENEPRVLEALRELEFVAVRTHSDTLRILRMLDLDERIRLVTHHFLVLPDIVQATDLAVLMPRSIAQGIAPRGTCSIVELPLPLRDFAVSLHWSRRFQDDPANRWLRELVLRLFAGGPAGLPRRQKTAA